MVTIRYGIAKASRYIIGFGLYCFGIYLVPVVSVYYVIDWVVAGGWVMLVFRSLLVLFPELGAPIPPDSII